MRLTAITLKCLMLLLTVVERPSYASSADSDLSVVYQTSWASGIDQHLSLQEPSRDSITTVFMPQFRGIALKTSMVRTADFSLIANGTPRVEVVFNKVAKFEIGYEYELRWSTMIPADYPIDYQQPEIITQIHQSDYHIGPPPFSVILAGDSYQVDVRGATGLESRTFRFGTPLADEGKAVSWLLRYRPDDNGITAVTELYKDNVLVLSAPGVPNAYPGERNGYLKVGVYKWWWVTRPSDVSERTMYYGDVEIKSRRTSAMFDMTWSDPKTQALSSTYDPAVSVRWQNGIAALIDVQQTTPSEVGIAEDPASPGRKVLRASIPTHGASAASDAQAPQAQVGFQKMLTFSSGRDYLLRWSTYIPANLPLVSKQVIAEIHQGTASNLSPITLSIVGADYTFLERGGSPTAQQPLFTACCATDDRGNWVNWMLRYLPDGTGNHASTQLWKDGALLYASRGVSNAFATDNASYLRLGLIMPEADARNITTPVAVYFGPVSIGTR